MLSRRFKQTAKVARTAGFRTLKEDDGPEAIFIRDDFPSEIELWSHDSGEAALEYSLALEPEGVPPRKLLRAVAKNAKIISDVTHRIKKGGYSPKTRAESDGYLDVGVKIQTGRRGPNLKDIGRLLQIVDTYLAERR